MGFVTMVWPAHLSRFSTARAVSLCSSRWNLLILTGYLVLNFIVDNVIKPRFMQSGLDVPPLLGLLSLLVWSYLLGAPGALLAIPLTIAIRRVVLGGKVPSA